MKQTDKCECGHKYSKEMNQKHPRRCVICGKKETQPNNILCFRCLEWNKSEEICNLRIKNINDCCEIHNQRLNKSHSQPLLSTKQSDVRAYGDKTGEMVNHLQPSPMPYTPLNQDLFNPCMKCGSIQDSICYTDLISALNGLKYVDKLALDKFMDRIWDSRIYLDKRKVQEEFRDLREQLIQNKEDWFDIDEVNR